MVDSAAVQFCQPARRGRLPAPPLWLLVAASLFLGSGFILIADRLLLGDASHHRQAIEEQAKAVAHNLAYALDLEISAAAARPENSVRSLGLPDDDDVDRRTGILPSERVQALLEAYALPTEWAGTVFDRDGVALARLRKAPSDDVAARLRGVASEGILLGASDGGIPVLVAFSRSGLSDWIAAVEVPLRLAEHRMRSALWQIAGGGLLFLLLAGGSVWVLVRRTKRPIGALDWCGGAATRRLRKTKTSRHKKRRASLSSHVLAGVTAHNRRGVSVGVPMRRKGVFDPPARRGGREVALASLCDPASGCVALLRANGRDIADRKRVEEALRDSEERFRAVVAAVPGIVMTNSADQGCDFVNPWFYEYTGLPAKSAEGNGWIGAVHPEDRPRVTALWKACSKSGRALEAEYRFRATDGTYRWFAVRKRPLKDEGGRIVKWFSTGIDIDDLKRAQEETHRINSHLSSILCSISDCYYTLDREWRLTEVNPQAAEFAGGEPEDFIGRCLWDAVPAVLETEFEQELRRAMAARVPIQFECPSKLRPGRWLSYHVYPQAEGSGLSVFYRDITTRKTAELNACATQALLQSTMDSLSAHIAILDRDGTIVAVNAAWRRFAEVSGYNGAGDHGVGCNYLSVCERARASSQEAASVADGLRAVMSGRIEEFRSDYPCHNDAEERWFQLRITRFGSDAALRLVTSHEDITEVKRTEAALHHLTAQLLDAQDAERRRVARELHDSTAQTLLGATLGIDRVKRLAPNLPKVALASLEESREMVDAAQREIRTVSYLLHPPLLDEAGLPAALRWYVQGFSKRSGIAVDLEVAPALIERRFPGDIENALFRMVQEGLANVHRHSGSRTARIRLSLDHVRGRDGLQLLIEDHGHGFAADRDLTSFCGGGPSGAILGVGLMGMRERLHPLGGRMTVRSGPEGTVIRALVPCRDVTPAPLPAIPAQQRTPVGSAPDATDDQRDAARDDVDVEALV